MAARRSIVEFEKWVDREIAAIHTELYGLKLEQESVDRKRAVQEVRLETLQQVKAKLQQPDAEDAGDAVDARLQAVAR